jgi:hypothetical protein
MATLLDIVQDVRLRIDDLGHETGTPGPGYTYTWEESDRGALFGNRELVRHLNAAHREIAARTRCYRDGYSPLCQISVVAGTPEYAYDPTILSIEEVFLESASQPLQKVQLRDLRGRAFVESYAGTPTHYAEETAPFRVLLYPTPLIDDLLRLTVYRHPLVEWTWELRNETLAEPPTHLFEALVQGALMYAYQKRDTDTADGGRQAFHAKEFEKLTGPAVDFRTLEDRRWNANLDTEIIPSPYTVTRRGRRAGWGNSW